MVSSTVGDMKKSALPFAALRRGRAVHGVRGQIRAHEGDDTGFPRDHRRKARQHSRKLLPVCGQHRRRGRKIQKDAGEVSLLPRTAGHAESNFSARGQKRGLIYAPLCCIINSKWGGVFKGPFARPDAARAEAIHTIKPTEQTPQTNARTDF